jgi:hypothetical protein
MKKRVTARFVESLECCAHYAQIDNHPSRKDCDKYRNQNDQASVSSHLVLFDFLVDHVISPGSQWRKDSSQRHHGKADRQRNADVTWFNALVTLIGELAEPDAEPRDNKTESHDGYAGPDPR